MGGTLVIVRYVMLVVVILGAGGLGFLLIFDGKISNLKGMAQSHKNVINNTKEKKKKEEKKSFSKINRKVNVGYTQDTLPFESIEIFSPDDPIGLIVKRNNQTFIGIIEVYGINYNLLDIEERELLEKSFEMLLNGIDYPIQLFIQSRKIDIENYKKLYENRLAEIKKALEKTLDKIKFFQENKARNTELAELIEKGKRLESQYQYGVQLKEYIISRCQQKNMLERRYYISISHTYNATKFKEELTKQEILSNAFFDIQNKASSLIGALQRAKLDGKLLTGEEVAELLYIAYNKADSEHYRLENAFRSKFSHLYTTSEAVEVKAMKRRLKELEKAEREIIKEIEEAKRLEEIESIMDKVGA
jgi:hypothetical protein